MKGIFTRRFWVESIERAVKTSAQSAILVLGADQINIIAADWSVVGGFAAGGAVISILTSIASAPFSNDGPSLV